METQHLKTKRARLAAVMEDNCFVLVEDAFRCNLQSFCYKVKVPAVDSSVKMLDGNDDNDSVVNFKDIVLLLEYLSTCIIRILANAIIQTGSVKFNLLLECTYAKTIILNEIKTEETQDVSFKTKNFTLQNECDITEELNAAYDSIVKEEHDFQGRGSGWTLKSIDAVWVRISKYCPLRGSSYIDLPVNIKKKKAIVNVKNFDNRCFKWAILSKHVTGVKRERLDHRYFSEERKSLYDFSMINYPTSIHDINKFEKLNNVSINVYTIGENYNIKPLKVCKEEKSKHFDLLYLKNEKTSHYCYITDLSKLIRLQLSKMEHAIKICKRCFTFYYKTDPKCDVKMHDHLKRCVNNEPARIQMPEPNEDGTPPELTFKNYQNKFPVPIVAYADFESILRPVPHATETKTYNTERHIPMSYCLYFVCDESVDEELKKVVPSEPLLYRGPEADRYFTKKLKEVSDVIALKLARKEGMIFNDESHRSYNAATACKMCCKMFNDKVIKVRDHCHFTGRYRDALCSSCNLRRRSQNCIPIFIHNATNYDSHFIIRQLGYDSRRIDVIPRSSEKLVSFTKNVANNLSIKFVDTFQFMASSLDALVNNLPNEKFNHMSKFFSENDLPLVTRKGVYPYEYTSTWSVLDETSLPSQDKFYSKLTDSHIKDEEYARAQAVWDHFDCQTLGDYSDLYLKTDVLLLADIFENFRALCMKVYGLDCAHYLTAPGFSFDSMLYKTGVELELLTDPDMYMFVESGIRGGITSCVKKNAKANNPYIPETYDHTQPCKYVQYIDANNLYGYAMSKALPYSGFKWIDDPVRRDVIINNILIHSDDADQGYMMDVDIEYPRHLHDDHSDLPLLPTNEIPPIGKDKKLMTTLTNKNNYVCHYTTLKQAINNGLRVTKVHRILVFYQRPWLKPYIDLNTRLRQAASNDFEKDFYKLMNNAIFGKTMENVRNRMNLEIVSCHKRLEKLIAKPSFLGTTIYTENLCAVTRARDTVTLNKPIYVGLSILDMSKTHMYDFHYNVMKPKYGSKLNLLYMDTDSFFYEIETEDIYLDMLGDDLSDYFDTSDFPKNHPCYSVKNKKVLGKMKDETNGVPLAEYVGLRAKLYSFKTANGKVTKKAKGVKKCVVNKNIDFEDYKACLEDPTLVITRSMRTFQSRKHIIHTTVTNKKALLNYDDKRVAIDCVNTLPWGHYNIPSELYSTFKLEVESSGSC